MRVEDVKNLMNDRLYDLKIGTDFEDALLNEVDQVNSSPFIVEIEQNENTMMYKVFIMTLREETQDWFYTLPSRKISNFKELSFIFTKEYTSYWTIKEQANHMFNLPRIYCELTIAPSLTLEEVFVIALRYMLWDNNGIVEKKFAKQADQSPKKAGQRGDKPSSRNYGGKRKAPCRGGAPTNKGYMKFTIPIHQILA
ncbi:hypothetical protein L3X38_033062 [Prunus dulcis]|uniref:Uncharacterized protein n=1 Tax=Prunus dulcis TaxID=3755 RepID=A0AAD4VGM7_PRUDU|nr:hypothetical protein L3X38_033062 [Prunus dulcis]